MNKLVKIIKETLRWVLLVAGMHSAYGWESQFYPASWTPGQKDSAGRFLHDFSYAGYHHGEKEIPSTPSGAQYDVTQPPYNADNTGVESASEAIQRAIDDAGLVGGGVVYLPAGKYRIEFQAGQNYGLALQKSGVVLRGEGRATKLYTPDRKPAGKSVILIGPPGASPSSWSPAIEQNVTRFTSDVTDPAFQIPVQSVAGYAVGDWVVLRTSESLAFANEHGVSREVLPWGDRLRYWDDPDFVGIRYYRQVTAVDSVNKVLTINVPTRYPLKTRDDARVYKVADHIQEVGVENLTIGQREPLLDVETYDDDTRSASVIKTQHVVHSWIRNVHSYNPEENTANFHIAALGFDLGGAFLTVEDCYLGWPVCQEGGSGYMYQMVCNETLVKNCVAENSRHNFISQTAICSGNVFTGCTSKRTADVNPLHNWNGPSDFHRLLTHSCLVDNFTLDGDRFEANFRGTGTVLHGFSTSQTVFWNTNLTGSYFNNGNGETEQASITTEMWGHGYVIGTRGEDANNVSYADYIRTTLLFRGIDEIRETREGLGQGASLDQPSLYHDQLARRLNRGELISAFIAPVEVGEVNHAHAGSMSVPSPIGAGETVTLQATFINRGTTTWSAENEQQIAFYREATMPFQTSGNGLETQVGDQFKVAWSAHRGYVDSHFFTLPAIAAGDQFELQLGNFSNDSRFNRPKAIEIWREGVLIGALTGGDPAIETFETWRYTTTQAYAAGNYEIRVEINDPVSGNMAFDDFKVRGSAGALLYQDPVENNGAWVSGGESRWALQRFFLPAGVEVAPGQSYTFNVEAQAPPTNGTYPVVMRLFLPGEGWFGEASSSQSTEVVTPVLVKNRFSNQWGSGNGDWNEAANWTRGEVPGPSTETFLDFANQTATLRSDGGAVRHLQIGSEDQGGLIIDGGSLRTISGSQDRIASLSRPGRLTIRNGGVLDFNNPLQIGSLDSPDAEGLIFLEGGVLEAESIDLRRGAIEIALGARLQVPGDQTTALQALLENGSLRGQGLGWNDLLTVAYDEGVPGYTSVEGVAGLNAVSWSTPSPMTLSPGQTFSVSLEARNTGTTTWNREREYAVGLYEPNPLARQTASNGLTPTAGTHHLVAWGLHRGKTVAHSFALPATTQGYRFELDFGNFTNDPTFYAPQSVEIWQQGSLVTSLLGAVPSAGEYVTWSGTQSGTSATGPYEIRVTMPATAGGNMAFDHFRVSEIGSGASLYSDLVDSNERWYSAGPTMWIEPRRALVASDSLTIPAATLLTELTLQAPTEEGSHTVDLHLFQEGAGWFTQSPLRLNLTVEKETLYRQWAENQNGSLPSTLGNVAADHDSDGVSNFQEYVFNSDPTSAASRPTGGLASQPGTGEVTLSFPRRMDPELVYELYEAGADLDFAKSAVQPPVPSAALDGEVMMQEIEVPRVHLRRLYQIRVSYPQ